MNAPIMSQNIVSSNLPKFSASWELSYFQKVSQAITNIKTSYILVIRAMVFKIAFLCLWNLRRKTICTVQHIPISKDSRKT